MLYFKSQSKVSDGSSVVNRGWKWAELYFLGSEKWELLRDWGRETKSEANSDLGIGDLNYDDRIKCKCIYFRWSQIFSNLERLSLGFGFKLKFFFCLMKQDYNLFSSFISPCFHIHSLCTSQIELFPGLETLFSCFCVIAHAMSLRDMLLLPRCHQLVLSLS